MSIVFLASLSIPALIAIFAFLRSSVKGEKRPVHEKIQQCRNIASFKAFGAKCLHDRLVLRSTPNQRLVLAFKLNSSFTTTDVQIHRDFLRNAVLAINSVNLDNEKWVQVFDSAISALQSMVNYQLRQEKIHVGDMWIPLSSTVRVVCFASVIQILFPMIPAKSLRVSDILKATVAINRLWVQSKDGSVSVADQMQLRSAIVTMLPLAGSTGFRANPLDLIMPAYETLWRIVLLTYVHVAFRAEGSCANELLPAIVGNTPRCLGAGGEEEKAVLAFAKEALRLYPPTRRIYRAMPGDSCSVAGDIESLHHDDRIWGPDVMEFRPDRFLLSKGLTPEQTDAYMPFGARPHMCPAGHGFGERIIALMVIVLLKSLGTSKTGVVIRFLDDTLDRDTKEPLPTGREDMEMWEVRIVRGN